MDDQISGYSLARLLEMAGPGNLLQCHKSFLINFILSILNFARYRFVTAFEPTSIAEPYINVGSFLAGPTLMCLVIGLIILYFKKIKKSSVYTI